MCLTLGKDQEMKIAIEDITVFKAVLFRPTLQKSRDLHLKEFSGIIKGHECHGKIFIHEDEKEIGIYFENYYLCTDDPDIDGSKSPDRLGYKYSWSYDNSVSSIVVDGKELCPERYITPYRESEVKIGETYSSSLIKSGVSGTVTHGLHSFTTLEGCKKNFRNWDTIFVKCIIPAGSTYYVGTFMGIESIASNAIEYVEIIE